MSGKKLGKKLLSKEGVNLILSGKSSFLNDLVKKGVVITRH